jgi:two-component sensor histidine kinase
MHKAVHKCLNITEASKAFLETIEQKMGIVADLSRADVLLYGRLSEKEAVVLSHAPPHSLAHVYVKSREGYIVNADRRPEILHTFISGKPQNDQRGFIAEGAPVVRKTIPVYFPPPPGVGTVENGACVQSRLVAMLAVVTNLIEYERHRLRSKVFREALQKLQVMLSYGQLPGAEKLSPFGEQDGIVFTDSEGVIRYASGIAANFYRRLGYRETLVGRHMYELETQDEEFREAALTHMVCLEREAEEVDRYWIRKAIPLVSYSRSYRQWLRTLKCVPLQASIFGVIITLHDDTESRRQNQELRVKNAMIQEVHHRVKNNLQTIAGMLRMQARRTESEEARQALEEALSRILSVAIIHEFLSGENSNIINIKEVSSRIIAQFQQGMLSPDKAIQLELTGESIFLPARQATACSLIINELLQNALEHGFEHKQEGIIRVNLEDKGNEVVIQVTDNGEGLPDDFELDQTPSLGFQIVKTLVEGDLKGQLELSNGNGLTVVVKFPKILFKGEEGWKEHVSL